MTTKTCKDCNQVKETEEFYFSDKNKGNRQGYCIECSKQRSKIYYANGYGSRYYNENKEASQKRAKDFHYKKNYGITFECVVQMIAEQDGKCGVCKEMLPKESVRRHVDHCHTTGKVRGVLCGHCNSILGMAKDNPTILRNAAIYLEQP